VIQATATAGLLQAIENLESFAASGQGPDLAFFRRQQAIMLGAAEHFYSRAGEIVPIVLAREDGAQVPLVTHVESWVRSLEEEPASAADSVAAYARVLHLHPFGDSNGRIAEVAKQVLLRRLGLPALLTPEKTSIETYRDSVGWGQTDFTEGALSQVRDTLEFLRPFEKLARGGWEIGEVSLSGSSVVAMLRRASGGRAVLVIARALETTLGGALPPAPGAIVLAGERASALRLHLGVGGWSDSPDDLPPADVVPAPRVGDLQVAYPFYFRELGAGEAARLVFAFHYTHAEGHEVWFNNGGRDYRFSPCVAALEP
jgi:hypothetical protein